MANANTLRRKRRKDYEVRLVDYETVTIAGVREEVPFLELDAARDKALHMTRDYLRENGVSAGRDIVVFVSSNTNGFLVVLDCIFGVEVSQAVPGSEDVPVRVLQVPAGRAAMTTHIGTYSEVMDAHAAVHDWCRREKVDATGINWEVHEALPDDPLQRRVDVYYAVTE
jgi:effector-binding domain-containing protein